MTTAATVLLTGFEPFAGESVNPSAEIARQLHGETVAGARVHASILPVTYANAPGSLAGALDSVQPDLVIALGQAGGRAALSLERVAINLADARIPDNAGAQPAGEAILHGAATAHFSNLPLKAMQARLETLGIPARLSLSAGSFVCNQVFFVLMHDIATRHPHRRGGFIHVPWLPEQATRHPGDASMALDTMVAGVRAALECALVTPHDLGRAGGATH
jgi:pyroglutamyl-peptidase